MSGSEDADLSAVADRDLIARIAAGDATAPGVMYDRHGAAAFGLACGSSATTPSRRM